ncbi:hypothetical protein A2957_00690 [Candidatus Roizmanbacteria bacterium RIFCSPLOWO2_01_FULL_38_11]|uniref:RnfC Barrel sandwich hybrid domain-containing protein n=1 Tax=Candidatus Roizmanbacteria bacterium RIFCSPLOWO2_01_FULL_38_11 TaxID=1802060 RepID=A0A1F7IMD9_9BACT|nr:MAG: hypothetical protein A2957_00690 [Candidatus Roizmanbacteria bacterium RIFCSPLOWO2_01_FULL_38_11]
MTIKLQLPEDSFLIAKEGKVLIGDPLYSQGQELTETVHLSEKLNIKPEKIFQHLRVVIGDEVKKGTILAEKRGLLGMSSASSEHEGKIAHIDHTSGTMTIATSTSKKKAIPSFFEGIIETFDSSKKLLTIEIGKAKPIELKEVSNNGGGKVCILNPETDYFTLTEEQISGSIIVLDEPQLHFEPKLEALSIRGYAFLKGTPSTDLPYIKIKSIEDYGVLRSGKYSHIIFSSFEKKALLYLI